ncbi:hypothetical protein HY469_06015 [Candidatus Roizmanbacteria bacterium]|nr:hypothetical protein [Candidatus Roizmanbacteria bacterium]
MHIPTLFICGSETDRKKKAEALAATYTVSSYDHHVIARDETKKSLGIEHIKVLKQQLELSSIRGTRKIGLVYELQYATTEAQNALLKLLEEPDESTILIVTADHKEDVLPTVVSRCRLISLQPDHTQMPAQEQIRQLDTLLRSPESKRLELAEQLVSENRAGEWLSMTVQILRHKLLSSVGTSEIQNTNHSNSRTGSHNPRKD